MRQVGVTTAKLLAEQFTDFLTTQGIAAHVEPWQGDSWGIWVHQEDDVPQARADFDLFQANPADPRFQNVGTVAKALRRKEAAELKARENRVVDVKQRWAGPRLRDLPVTMTLIGICVLVAFATNLGSDNAELINALMFRAKPTLVEQLLSGGRTPSPLSDIMHGQVWRVITPIFLHFGGLHILFNMLWLHTLGGRIEFLLNRWRLLGMVLFIAAISNLAQGIWFSPYFGGMSGVVYGLFVYVWLKGVFEPRSAFGVSPGDVLFMGVWLVLGMSDQNLNVANGAHLFGAISGGVIALAESFVLKTTKRA